MALWFIPLIKAVIPLAKVVAWPLITYFAAKPVIERWGSTPANRAEQILGIPKDKLPEHRQKYLDDRKGYLEDRQETHKKELDELYKKVEKLEEEKTQVSARLNDPNISEEDKAKLFAQLASLDTQLKDVKGQIGKKEKVIASDEKAIDDLFKEIGKDTSLTTEQVQSRSNTPDLKAWINWGIIFVVFIVVIMVTKMVMGLFKSIAKGTKE